MRVSCSLKCLFFQAPLVSKCVLNAWSVFPWRHFKGKVSLRSLISLCLAVQCTVTESRRIHKDYSWKVNGSSVTRERIAAYMAPGAVLLCSRQLSKGMGCAELCLWQVSAAGLWLCALQVEVTSQGSCPSRDRDTECSRAALHHLLPCTGLEAASSVKITFFRYKIAVFILFLPVYLKRQSGWR